MKDLRDENSSKICFYPLFWVYMTYFLLKKYATKLQIAKNINIGAGFF